MTIEELRKIEAAATGPSNFGIPERRFLHAAVTHAAALLRIAELVKDAVEIEPQNKQEIRFKLCQINEAIKELEEVK